MTEAERDFLQRLLDRLPGEPCAHFDGPGFRYMIEERMRQVRVEEALRAPVDWGRVVDLATSRVLTDTEKVERIAELLAG